MAYSKAKTAVKGGNEALVMVVSSIIATNLVPLAQQVGIDIDPAILAVSIVALLGTLAKVTGNFWKHRKDGK